MFECAKQLKFEKECEFVRKNGYDGDVPQTLDVDWDWLTDETINDAPSVEYNQVLNESETESASDICSSPCLP